MELSEEEFAQLKSQVLQLSEQQRYALCDMRYETTELKEIFSKLKQRFDERLKPGQKADLRKASWQKIALVPAYHELYVPKPEEARWQRVAHGLALHAHLELKGQPEDSLGRALGKLKLHPQRLFQLARLESPEDLNALRRILHQKPPVCWEQLGLALYFWSDKQKERVLRDYFLETSKQADKDKKSQ